MGHGINCNYKVITFICTSLRQWKIKRHQKFNTLEEPTKVTFLTSGESISKLTTSTQPLRHWITPGGNPACCISSKNFAIVIGTFSLGFNM